MSRLFSLLTPRGALALAVLSVIIGVGFGQMRLYYDYAWQLMSVRDYAQGATRSPFIMRSADPNDLSRDREEWTIGYPLAYNTTGALLTATGLGAEAAHRTIVVSSVLLGLAGWHLLFAALGWDPRLRATALLALAASFQGIGSIFFFMPEASLFAFVPWQLWGFLVMTSREAAPNARLRAATILGIASGLVYTWRYLAAFHSLPLLAFAAIWLSCCRPRAWIGCGALLAVTAAFPAGVMSALNYAHTGAINSAGSGQPWSVALHWPSLNQWLLVLTGPMHALLGASLGFGRLGEFLAGRVFGLVEYDATLTVALLTAVPSLIAAFCLLHRYAPRNRVFAVGALGWAGTGVGLLWLFSRSGIPQTDVRYFAGPALLLFPSLGASVITALRTNAWSARGAVALVLIPLAVALGYSGYAFVRQLRALEPGGHGAIVAGGGVDVRVLRRAVASRVPADREVIWMCFQPGVLHALGGRHVIESYAGPVIWRTACPVTLVVLRDQGGAMHPSIYEHNYRSLELAGRAPDFTHGNYDVFLCPLSPAL